MYVCHCEVVNDRAIRSAIADGASDVADVASRCGAGAACAGCHPTIEELLAEAAVAVRDVERLRRWQGRRRWARLGSPAPGPATGAVSAAGC
jgi:bacterioferritin-associated ferredoxin